MQLPRLNTLLQANLNEDEETKFWIACLLFSYGV